MADDLATHFAVTQIGIMFSMFRVFTFAGFSSISLRFLTAISVAISAAVSAVTSTVSAVVSAIVIKTRRCARSGTLSRVAVGFVISFSTSSLLVTTTFVYARVSLKTRITVPVYTSTRIF